MSIRNLIILSQLNPPAAKNQVLLRARVQEKLQASLAYPLTVLKAGTGYGKSTAIISFINSVSNPVFWYTMAGPDRDPTLFLAKLFTAFNKAEFDLGEEALRILDIPGSTLQEAMIVFINHLTARLEEPSLLILDDYHRVFDVPEITTLMDWFLERLPPQIHVIIASRRSLHFPSINKWKIKDRIQTIGKEDLIFNVDEIYELFRVYYDIDLKDVEIKQLVNRTEGWAIGLQMVWQSMQSNPMVEMSQVLEGEQESKQALFEYLAEEVLSRLEPAVQDFLIKTSILSKLDSDTCDFLLTTQNSDRMLSNLHSMGLFIDELQPNVFRYHQIFQEFLQNRLEKDQKQKLILHRKLASYFSAHEYWERAISHLLTAGDFKQVNQVLETIGEQMIQKGRYESIKYWISLFPESVRKKYPYLFYLQGEVQRYSTRFEEALESYQIAEELYRAGNDSWGTSISLRGQARVYLDTIRPLSADHLLQEALLFLNPEEMPEEVALLLTLKAENQLNLGYPRNAEELLGQSIALNNMETENELIKARLYLRTGRLKEGISLLEKREAGHATSTAISRPQRFHREASLLLSLFYVIQGDIQKAYRFAQRGISIGEQLQSTFVQSVGMMRLAHALQLQSIDPWSRDGIDKAIEKYQGAIDKVDVSRIHVEPLWGMCRALGYSGKIQKAEELALESLSIAQKAGDEWILTLIRISVGAGEVLNGNNAKAQNFLTLAESSAKLVQDPFVHSTALLWLSINAWQSNDQSAALQYLKDLLPLIREHGYQFLLEKETFLGPNDKEILKPMLIAAWNEKVEVKLIESILSGTARDGYAYHPGYTLWVRTLDTFHVWRGSEPVGEQEWKREKAKALFQLLVANRGKWLHRDKITSILWPDAASETALNSLKVTLNALNQVLEPHRPRGEAAFFIERQHELYRLNPNGSIKVDTDVFESFIEDGSPINLQQAVDLYQAHYFNDSYIQEWLVVDDQYFHQKFLIAAQHLAEHYMQERQLEKALDVTYKMLTIDSLCEPAYCLQMQIFHEMQRYAMVHNVFNQCENILEKSNNIPLSSRIKDIYAALSSAQS